MYLFSGPGIDGKPELTRRPKSVVASRPLSGADLARPEPWMPGSTFTLSAGKKTEVHVHIIDPSLAFLPRPLRGKVDEGSGVDWWLVHDVARTTAKLKCELAQLIRG